MPAALLFLLKLRDFVLGFAGLDLIALPAVIILLVMRSRRKGN